LGWVGWEGKDWLITGDEKEKINYWERDWSGDGMIVAEESEVNTYLP
jgi:hypothetical protein